MVTELENNLLQRVALGDVSTSSTPYTSTEKLLWKTEATNV